MTRIKPAEDLLAIIQEILSTKYSLKLLNRNEVAAYLFGYNLSAQAVPQLYADQRFPVTRLTLWKNSSLLR